MTSTPVRFAILGFGLHGIRRLIPAFAQCEHASLVGIWRRDQAAAALNCAEFAIPLNFPTPEALCSSPQVDIVFITSPDAMHRDDTLLALRHGKAVLCEKPLAMNTAEAIEMNAAANAEGLLFGVAHNFRYNRNVQAMREQIAAGAIGQPQIASAQFNHLARASSRKWITDATLARGGPIGDVGVHCIDVLRFILGRNVLSISTLARKDEFSAGVEAIASMQMEMTGGVFATVIANGRSAYRTLVEVQGSDGVLIAENGLTPDHPVDLVLRRAGDLVQSTTVDNSDTFTRMLDSFALAFHNQATFAASGADSIENMRTLDAAYTSWHTGLRQPL